MTKAEEVYIKIAKQKNELGLIDSVATFNRVIRTNKDGTRNSVMPNSEYAKENLSAQLKGALSGAAVGGAGVGTGALIGSAISGSLKIPRARRLVGALAAGGAIVGGLVGQTLGATNQQQEYLAERGVTMNVFGKITDATPKAKKKYFK